MIRTLLLAFAGLVLVTVPARAADDAARHSGRVAQVTDGGQTIVLEEMGPWHGPGTGLHTRTIHLTSGTAVRLLRPTAQWQDNSSPGYEVRTIDAKDLRPGDFVTVLPGSDGRVAAAVDVVRPEDGGSALPRESGR
jgi:hypothetical protein